MIRLPWRRLLANVAAEQAVGRAAGGLVGVLLSELCEDRFMQQYGEQVSVQLRRDGY